MLYCSDVETTLSSCDVSSRMKIVKKVMELIFRGYVSSKARAGGRELIRSDVRY